MSLPVIRETAADLPLKLVHGFPYRTDAPFEEKCAVVKNTLEMLKSKGFGGVVSNVRFENYTKSPEEWAVFAFLADECERQGMRLWIYDEKGYPSGGAGGLTLEENPDFEAVAVVMVREPIAPHETRTLPLPHGHSYFLFAGVYAADGNGTLIPAADGRYLPLDTAPCRLSTEPVTLTNPTDAPAVLCAFVRKRLYEGTHCVHNVSECRRYIDVTNPDAVRAFIGNTYQKYYDAVPEHFTAGAGRLVPEPGKIEAFFTDEPSFMGCYINAGLWPRTVHDPYDKEIPLLPVMSYGRDVESAFRSRYGYDLLPELVGIFLGETDHARAVRTDYWTLMSDLYESAFFGQLSDWCFNHEISFSGHILLEDLIMHHTVFEGNFFSLLRHMQTPGIDMLHSLPALVRRDGFTPKLVSSIAHAYGRPHVMSEVSAHAQGGHVTRDQMYGSLCVQYALGVDTFHYYYSENAMDTESYDRFNRALGKMNAAMTGSHVCEALVYYPIETFRMHHRPSDAQYGSYTPEETACQNGVHALQYALFDRQIDFDYADTEVLSRCRTENGRLTCPSGETVSALLLPPCEITPALAAVIGRLTAAGVPVLALTDEHFTAPAGAALYADPAALAAALDPASLTVASDAPAPGILTLCRDTAHGRALLIVNSNEAPASVSLTVAGITRPVLFDPMANGAALSAELTPVEGGARVSVTLASCRAVVVMEEE